MGSVGMVGVVGWLMRLRGVSDFVVYMRKVIMQGVIEFRG